MPARILALLCVACWVETIVANVALTPQMGWNSWNKFNCDISEELIRETADALVSTGLSSLGYSYINIDDCWQADTRDADGRLQANSTRFPSGMEALGEYIHSKGLKFGLYSSAGFKTCQGYPASLGLEDIDAETFISWGVDYLKYDNCYTDHAPPQDRFKAMATALHSIDESFFLSLCEWGRENPAVWASDIFASSWRISGDITDSWDSILSRAEISASLWRYAGPNNGWNDPDMLEVGNGKCTDTEYQSHFSIWAILKAPLIIGNDIREFSSNTSSVAMSILSNSEVIAVNQDKLGYQARRIWSDSKGLSDGRDKVIAVKCATGETGSYEDDINDQQWSVQADGTILSASTGLCLNELDSQLLESISTSNDKSISLGLHAVSTADCSSATKWNVGAYQGGSIVSQDSGLCLQVAKLDLLPEAQGKTIMTAPCQVTSFPKESVIDIREHQSWTTPNGKLLNLYQRQCLTIDRDAYTGETQEIWASPLEDGSYAVMLLNKGPIENTMTLSYDILSVIVNTGSSFHIRDLWDQKDLTNILTENHAVTLLVKSHGVRLLKLTPVS